MGGELDGEITPSAPPPQKSLSEVFEEHFPYYLEMGMPAKDFWEGDVTLVKAYRKADMLRRQRVNHDAWLQGMYFYEALCDASPLLNAFSKEGKSFPYIERPYAITAKEAEEREKEQAMIAADQFRLYAAELKKKRGGKNGY